MPAKPQAALSAALGTHRVAWDLGDCSCSRSWFGLAGQHYCWAEPPYASPRACLPPPSPVIFSASFPSKCAKSKPRTSLLSRELLQGEESAATAALPSLSQRQAFKMIECIFITVRSIFRAELQLLVRVAQRWHSSAARLLAVVPSAGAATGCKPVGTHGKVLGADGEREGTETPAGCAACLARSPLTASTPELPRCKFCGSPLVLPRCPYPSYRNIQQDCEWVGTVFQ